jgi:hypothetical protein
VHDTTLYLLLGDWFAWLTLAALVFTLMHLYRLNGAAGDHVRKARVRQVNE